MATTVAEQIIAQLIDAGVHRIYGIVGDSLNPLVDAVDAAHPGLDELGDDLVGDGRGHGTPSDWRAGSPRMVTCVPVAVRRIPA